MKIAHIVCTYKPYFGGMGNHVFEVASELDLRGHEVTVLTPGYFRPEEYQDADAPERETHAPDLESKIHEVKRLAPSFSYGNAARLPTIGEELDDMDIVHLHYPFFGTANLVRKWKLRNPRTPLVITYHMDAHAGGWKGWLFRLYAWYWMPQILGAGDALITTSFDYIAHSQAKQLYHQYKEKWVELPFGVDIERFAPGKKNASLIKAIGMDPHRYTVLFVGGMDSAHFFKGVPILLSACHQLYKQGADIQVLLVGDGDLRPEFEQTVQRYNMGSRVFFTGRVDDETLPELYRLGDLFVLPSITQGEAFGIVLLEAMASGIPVCVTDLPGVRVVAGQDAAIVPPSDAQALAKAIDAHRTLDPVQKKKLRDAVRARMEQKFAWEPIVDRLEKLYTTLTHF